MIYDRIIEYIRIYNDDNFAKKKKKKWNFINRLIKCERMEL